MSNTDQIVRQIIDILTDSVSDLVLMVVVLREQNAQMPPQLPASSNAVNETAKKLGLIARKLASTDYKDFAEIATEINQAADALDSATQVMGKAVANLTGGAKKEGWDQLVDACRVVSGKTIRLLQIVYGAPLKRLKINADRLLDEANKFNEKPKGLKDQKAQQKLLDEMKPLTDKALRLEKHLNDRAKVADSPQARQELQEAAADARKAAQGLVDAVNDAINNHPDNADLSKAVDAVRKAAESGREASDKHAPPAPKGIPDAPKSGAPIPSTGPKSLHDDIAEAKKLANEMPNVAKTNPGGYPEAHDKLKDKVEQIRKKAPAPVAAKENWKDAVEKPLLEQLKAGRDVAKDPHDGNAKKALDDATKNLVKALDNVENASKAPSGPQKTGPGAPPKGRDALPGDNLGDDKHPAVDPATKKQLVDKMKDLGPELAKAIPAEKKPKYERAKLKDNLQAMKADVKHKNPKHAAQHTKQAVNAAKELAKVAKDDLAKNPQNYTPEERAHKEEAVAAIEHAIPEYVAAAKDVLADFNNPEAQKTLDDKIRKLERAAERAAEKPTPGTKGPKWNKAKEDIAKAIEAVKKGDRATAKKALDEAKKPIEKVLKPNAGRGLLDRDPTAAPADELDKLFDQFRNAADRGDPAAVDAIIPKIEDAYKNYADVPKDAADRLADAVDAVAEAIKAGDPNPPIADLEDAFDKFVNDTGKDPSPEVRAAGARAAEELKPKLDDFIKKAQEAAKNPADKRKAQVAEAAVPPVKKAIEDFKKGIKPLDDDFQKAKEEMKKVADAVRKGNRPAAKKAVEDLAEKPFGRNWNPQKGRGLLPPSDADGPSDELKKLWDKFKNAGNRGDPKGMENAMQPIERNLKKVTEPPKKAAEDVQKAVDAMLDAANGKGDPEKAADELRDAVAKLDKEAKSNPSPEVREIAREAVEQINDVVDDFIRKADDAARHPQDKAKAQAAAQAANNVKKPLNNFKEKMKPIEAEVAKNKDEMKKAVQAAQKGDKPALKQALEKLAEKPYGITLAPTHAVPVEDPALELEKLWDQVKDAVEKGDARAVEKAIPEIEKQYERAAEKPKKAADKVKEAVNNLVDAVRDPTHTPPAPGAPVPPGSRIPDAIRDLQDAFDDFIREADDDPSPEVREEARRAAEEAQPILEEAIKKAVEAIKAPQDKKKAEEAAAKIFLAQKPMDAFKEKLKPMDDQFNKNKEQIKAAADQLKKGNKPAAKKAIESIEPKPFGRNFTPGKGRGMPPPEGSGGPSDELKKLWDRFKKGAEKGDPQAMERVIPEMAKNYQKVADKPKNAADKLKQAIDEVAKAAHEGNPNPPVNHLNKAFDDFVADTQSDPSPEVREEGARAADEVLPQLKELLKKAAEAAQHPQDKAKAQQVANAAAHAKKPLEGFKDRLKPLDDAYKRNQDEMKKAVDAVKKGWKPQAKKIIDDIGDKPFGRNFTPGKGKGLPPPDPATGPSDELKKLWDRMKKAANKGDAPLMEKTLPELDKAFQKVAETQNSAPIEAAEELEKAIDDAVAAVDDNRPIPLKEIKEALDNFQAETQNHPDPKVKYAGEKAVEEFKPEFAELIKKAKEVMENPNNPEKARAFEKQAEKAKQPIKVFKVDVNPANCDDALVNDVYGGDVKDAIHDLKDAVQAHKKTPEIKKALENVKEKLADYNNNAHEIAANTEDPGKANYIERKADELDDILDKLLVLEPESPQLLDAVEIVPALVDDILEHINSEPADDAVEGAARAANLSAFLDACDEDDLDLGDLLDTANDLADLMKGLIGQTSAVAEDFGSAPDSLTHSAKAALDLTHLLRDIESGTFSPEEAEAMSEKVSELRGTAAPTDAPLKSLAEATTFEDIAAAVAYNIKKQCDENSANISKTGSSVATELAALATAARKGDRQQMLLSAKAASAHIAALSKEILALAQKIPAKNPQERSIQDHLFRCSQGLQNYGTQLRILTSVKAASIEESKDTDESLSTIATDLGDIISQALTSMAITNSTILKGK